MSGFFFNNLMYCQKLDWKLKYVRNRSILCFHEDILSFISSLCSPDTSDAEPPPPQQLALQLPPAAATAAPIPAGVHLKQGRGRGGGGGGGSSLLSTTTSSPRQQHRSTAAERRAAASLYPPVQVSSFQIFSPGIIFKLSA